MRLLRPLLLVALVAWVNGCGADERGMAPVSGTVRYNGQPLAKAYVVFAPEEQGARSATGSTDENGHYRLTSFAPDDGARVGKHRVIVGAVSGPEMPDNPDLMPEVNGQPGKQQPSKLLTPARYNSYDTSGLTAEVVAGKKNVFDFDLTD
jgi:hypothetical protein